MDELNTLQSLGLTLPTPAYLLGAIVFGVLGYAAYRYGKRTELPLIRWLGVALMLYPYLISDTWALYGVGAALCAAVIYLATLR